MQINRRKPEITYSSVERRWGCLAYLRSNSKYYSVYMFYSTEKHHFEIFYLFIKNLKRIEMFEKNTFEMKTLSTFNVHITY